MGGDLDHFIASSQWMMNHSQINRKVPIMAGKKSSNGTLVAGWFMLLGLAFLFKLIPLFLVVLVIYYIAKGFQKPKESPIAEPEVITYTFEEYDPVKIAAMMPPAPAEPTKPIVPDNVIADAISSLCKLGTQQDVAKEAVVMAVENGANTLEEVIKQSFQKIYSN